MSIPSPFTLVDTDFNRSTEYALKLKSTAGHAVLTYGPNFPGSGVATGLANDTTAYTATVTVDGTPVSVSVVGSAAQTFANLITEINTDLATAATATLIDNTIVITSATTGTASTVTVADSGANHLFASVHGLTFSFIDYETVKGADEYVLWDKLDGVTQSNVAYTIDSFLASTTANTNTSWTSGSDAISFPTGSPTISTLTGLSISTIYQLNVAVDGAAGVEVLINPYIYGTLNNFTFTHLEQAINQALAAQNIQAVASYDTTAVLTLRITSKGVGSSSSVVITDGASNGLIAALSAFGAGETAATAGYQTVNVGGNKVGGTATGLAADVPATHGYATLAFTATPAITATTALGLPATNYDLNINVDGAGASNHTIALTGTDTLTTIAAAFNLLPITGATVSAVNNTLVVTSATTGTSSTIAITAGTSSDLIAAINLAKTATNTNVATAGVNTVVTTYTTTITVDGVGKSISLTGGAAQTYTNLLAEINTDLGASATATLVSGNIRITSATTGTSSSILAVTGTLFPALTGFVSISAAVAGTASPTAAVVGTNGTTNVSFPVTKDSTVWNNWGEVLVNWSSLLGTHYGPLYTSGNAAHLRKEAKPSAKGKAVNTYVYWDGSAWKFFGNDATVGSTVNPPELS